MRVAGILRQTFVHDGCLSLAGMMFARRLLQRDVGLFDDRPPFGALAVEMGLKHLRRAAERRDPELAKLRLALRRF